MKSVPRQRWTSPNTLITSTHLLRIITVFLGAPWLFLHFFVWRSKASEGLIRTLARNLNTKNEVFQLTSAWSTKGVTNKKKKRRKMWKECTKRSYEEAVIHYSYCSFPHWVAAEWLQGGFTPTAQSVASVLGETSVVIMWVCTCSHVYSRALATVFSRVERASW